MQAMTFNTSDNAQIYYQTAGNASHKPVVLIHGLGADHKMWKPQISTYPDKGFFVIVPDVRGHGKSSAAGNFSISACATDIAELLAHLQVSKAHIIGVSMGGVIAQQFACDYHDKLATLVITDSFCEVSSITEKLAGWLQWITIKLVPGLMLTSLETAYPGPDKIEVRNYFKSAFSRMDKKQLLMARKALNKFHITDRLQTIEVPTLVLVGDGFGNFALNMAQKTASKIKHSQLSVLPGGSDPSNLVVPEAFDRRVISFLNTYGPSDF